jgi:hypothetical protein
VSALFHGVLFSWFRSQNYILQPSYFQGAGQQRLAPYLDTVEMEMLVKHLTQIAEKPMLPPALLNKIPKLGQ